jgi:uncharacterized OB-fold protein
MKLLLVACPDCGATNTSPFRVCRDCESREVAARAATKRRIRAQAIRVKRAA